MKHLRKFDSLADLNAAIANSTIGMIGLAYNGSTAVIKVKPTPAPQPNDEIWYTSSDGNVVTPFEYASDPFGSGVTIVSNTYTSGKGIIKLSGNATTIGEETFATCASLTSITIPSSVTSIGYAAFVECVSLTSITIPSSVTTIGECAFQSCINLTSITIPSSVTSISDYTFRQCDKLTSITIPNNVTSIGEEAFQDCQSLTSVTIPNSVTTIGSSAFNNCTELTSVTIPNSVTTIGESAFNNCSGLTSIICLPTVPPESSGINEFDETNDCPIYVPAGSVDVYKSAWSSYASRIQAIPAN